MAIGVFALILVQATMSGFSHDLRDKILRFSSPIVVKPVAEEFLSGKKAPSIPSDPRITSVSPYLDTEVIVHTTDDLNQGAKLKGVEFDDPHFLKRLRPEYVEGLGPEDLASKEDVLPGILLGSEVAKRLNILPFLTEEVELIYPFGDVDPTGEMRPKTRRFRVIGTFKTGYYEFDNKYVLVHLPEARRLVPSHEVPTEWGVWVDKFFDAEAVAQEISKALKGSFQVESWGERNRKLFSALRLERVAMFLVLSVMVAIATFNIFSLILMMVVDKTQEIATFRAIGLSRQRVRKIFFQMGLLLGGLGTVLGLVLGLGAVLYLKWKPLHLPSSYYLENLPVRIDPLSIALVLVVAPLLTLLASWYPAQRGGRFDIAESLRYE